MPRIACLITSILLLAPSMGISAQEGRSAPTSSGYIVRAGDVLQIRVWPDSSLGGAYPVEETGVVYLPLVGAVSAGGRPIVDLREMLPARAATWLGRCG